MPIVERGFRGGFSTIIREFFNFLKILTVSWNGLGLIGMRGRHGTDRRRVRLARLVSSPLAIARHGRLLGQGHDFVQL